MEIKGSANTLGKDNHVEQPATNTNEDIKKDSDIEIMSKRPSIDANQKKKKNTTKEKSIGSPYINISAAK